MMNDYETLVSAQLALGKEILKNSFEVINDDKVESVVLPMTVQGADLEIVVRRRKE